MLCVTTRAANSDLLATTVRHETVHIVQDCIGGMRNGKMGSVTAYLAQGDAAQERKLDETLFDTLRAEGNLEHVARLTDTFRAPGAFIEVEAYALQNNQKAVHGLLDLCN